MVLAWPGSPRCPPSSSQSIHGALWKATRGASQGQLQPPAKGHSADISQSFKWFMAKAAVGLVVKPCWYFIFFHKGEALWRFFSPSFHRSLCQPRSCLFSCFRKGTAEGSSRFGILRKYLNRFWYFVMTSAAYDISALIQYWRIVTPGPQ